MFERILVPLDGSDLAEVCLPVVAYLAKKLHASVMLFHVIERDAPQQIHGERHLTNPEEAEAYLEKIAKDEKFFDLEITKHVHTGTSADVAHSIVEHIGEFGSGLIVMCTHGRGGLKSLLIGSIAQQVVNLSKTSILLIQPEKMRKEGYHGCQRLLVPLDGHPDHEQALPVAAYLARACTSQVLLAMVVPTYETLSIEQAATARMLPGSTSAILELTREDADSYLQEQMISLQKAGLEVVHHVQRGDPASMVIQLAKKSKADLIVLSTHAKAAGDAFWTGSVSPQIVRKTHLPILLVPVKGP